MERRTFLASVSASIPIAVAGCLGGQDDEPSTTTEPTETTTPTTTQTTDDDSGPLSIGDHASLSGDRSLGLVDVGASAFVVTRGTGDDRIHANAGERYVTVKFAPSGIDNPESFVAENVTLEVDGEAFSDPIFPIGGGPARFDAAYSIPTDLTPYDVSASVDTGDASATWAFGARAVETITQSVDYSVGSLSPPDSVPAGETFTAELPVDNGGDEITFYAVLEGTSGAPTLVSEDLPASTETTVEIDATAPETDADEFEFTVDWSHGEDTATVAYE